MSRTHASKTIFDLQSMQPSDKALWFSVHASIVDINMDDFHFLACPLFVDGVQCVKKIAHRAFNTWHCSKCDGEFTKCEYKYILKLSLQDHTGQINMATTFDDASNQLLSVSAKYLFLLTTEPSTINDISLQLTLRQYLFTLSMKTRTFNSTTRLKPTIVNSEEIPYADASTKILEEIHALTTQSHHIARRV